MNYIFAPGCALLIYKPDLAKRLHEILNRYLGVMPILDLCCMNKPHVEENSQVINICPGCDRRYRENYEKSTTISLWEVLADCDSFSFPDYRGQEMTITDACPTRSQARVYEAVRVLLEKMNIKLIEPERTKEKGVCCGDSFWGKLPTEKVKEIMAARAAEMPVEDVVVYCVSCSKSMFIGGKRPRYLVDLLFNETTDPQVYEPDEWHKEIADFVKTH